MPRSVVDTLLNPSSVAVIGASDNPFVFSGATVYNLLQHGYKGRIFPVNPRRDEVQGLPAYPSVLAIQEPVETAVVVVPPDAVVGVLEDCRAAGIASATVVSAGFGESGAGPAGQERDAALRQFIAEGGTRLLGPNTAGLLNLLDGYVPRAAANHLPPDQVRAGNVALVTQSGACSNILFNRAQANGVGVGLVCATGDEIDVDVWDVAEWCVADDRIGSIMMITESTGDVAKIRSVATAAAAARKPVALLKLGVSELGSRVVLTHSGSLAGDTRISQKVLRDWGILQVADFDELWQVARLFEAWGPPERGPSRPGVFAFSGGEAALIADHASNADLVLPPTVPEFDAAVERELAYGQPANPFDATGELVGHPEKLTALLTSFVTANNYSEVLVATPAYRTEAAQRILPVLAAALDDPRLREARIALSMWRAGSLTVTQEQMLSSTGRPVFDSSVHATQALAHYSAYREVLRRREEAPPAGSERPARPVVAPVDLYAEARELLAGIGLPFAAGGLAHTLEDAMAFAKDVGYPVVMKGNVPSTTHKASAGVVAVGIRDEAELSDCYASIAATTERLGGSGVLVEQLVQGPIHCFLGARRDPHFGPAIVFGLGGTAAEVVEDVSVQLTPDVGDGRALLTDTRIGRMIERSHPDLVQPVLETVTRLAGWFEAAVNVAEVDVNPVVLDLGRARAICVDARILLGSGTPATDSHKGD